MFVLISTNMFSWQSLPRPFFVLAPMHDVTDRAFRQLVSVIGKPDVMMTEFVSVDGLLHPASQERLTKYYLSFDERERPLIAQIWGTDPYAFLKAAERIKEMGFDGIDINMGCPDKKVVAMGAGAALINNPKRAHDIIVATQEGAGGLPVSVKTRLGFNDHIGELWIKVLIAARPAAITMHARTKKELSRVPAHWDILKRITPILKEENIPFIGNGDISSYEDAKEKIETSGVDGVMVGRGILGYPWFFSSEKDMYETQEKKLSVLISHAYLFEKYFSGLKNFSMIKKHVKGYVSGFSGAKELRAHIMNTHSAKEMEEVCRKGGYDITLLEGVKCILEEA